MKFRLTSKKLFLIILLVGIVLPFSNAHALSLFGLENLAYIVAEKFFVYSLSIMFTILGKFLAIAVVTMAWVVNMRIYTNIPVIQEGWKIMRDFANMLFIIALIVMAYGTIFNVQGYNFKSLIPKFLIAALLINFSLVIGGLVIDGTQILNNTFLAAMGDISGRLGQGLNPADLLPSGTDANSGEAIANYFASSMISLIFIIFLMFTFLVSVSVPLVIAFVRIPILWALLIVSPVIWLLNILPATQQVYKNWWKQFLAWNLFLPYYLFFMYFALYFLSKKDDVLRGLGQDFVYKNLTGLQSNFTFGLLFYYIMVAMFLIWGTKVAMNAGKFSGTGIVNVAKWGRSRVMRLSGIEGWQRGAHQKWQEMQKEGYGFGQYRFGGEKAFEAESLRRARMLGTKGALEKGVAAEQEKQKPFAHDIRKLMELAKSGNKEQMLAARKRLTELNALDKEEIDKTYRMFGRTPEAESYIASVDFGKRTKDEREEFSRTLTNIEARKKNAAAMIDKDKLTAEEIERLAETFSARDTTGSIINVEDIKEFLDKGKKKNLVALTQARINLGLAETDRIDTELTNVVKKMTDMQILELDRSNFEGPNGDTIRMALTELFERNPKRLENIVRQATGDLRDSLERISIDMIQHPEALNTNEQVDTLRTKKQRIANRANLAGLQQEIANIVNQVQQLTSQMNPSYPTSTVNLSLERQIEQLQSLRETRENQVRSVEDKMSKIDERIENITSGRGRRI